jgi:hypothetical protein
VILFTDNNSTYVFQYDPTSRELQSEKLLPVYLLKNDKQNLVQLKYTYSEKTKKVNYASFNQYLAVLFEKDHG